MKSSPITRQRCAIYTRKSTDHNLELAFNSLDAQREACEAYIKSQAHEGWSLVPARFDDGAFSGASLDRPALHGLLDLVREKKVDIIVVYKVDRLTRSLADFAKLVELFDQHEVSFVSVTQSFNTTSSMGRLTLNVLLSFAQFEREVIGERVRDKISASKRKGIWVGGPIPLGYRSVDKKLEVVPEDAALVRKIFGDYLALDSIGALSLALEREGVKPRPRFLSNGRTIVAKRFMVGPLAHLLKNRFYVGEIAYRGEIHKGEHQPILDHDLFDAVGLRLAERAVARRVARSKSPAILTGLIFDDRGNPMSPTHANKKGVRYRYYISHALLQNRRDEAGTISRVSAPDVEAIVREVVAKWGNDDATDLEAGLGRLEASAGLDRALIERHVGRIEIHRDRILVAQRPAPDAQNDLGLDDDRQTRPAQISVSFAPSPPLRKGVAHAPSQRSSMAPKTRDALLQAIARSRGWIEAIKNGEYSSFDAIAAAENLAERHVRFLAPLAFLSPRIVAAIADGAAPSDLTVSNVARALPMQWREQERAVGFD